MGVALWELDVDGGKLGEAWASPTSELQLLGFALLLLGTILYAQVCLHLLPGLGLRCSPNLLSEEKMVPSAEHASGSMAVKWVGASIA